MNIPPRPTAQDQAGHDKIDPILITPVMAHRILIADPNKTVRLAAQMVFAKIPDILVATALNSFEALDKMHLLKPTVTMMDADLAHQLCSNLKRPPSPVVVLQKPFTSIGLINQVREALAGLTPQSREERYSAQASENNI